MAALWKVALVFGVIIVLFKLKWHIGLGMIVAAVFMGMLFKMPAIAIARTALKGAIAPGTLEMVGTLVLIMFLEDILRRNGFLDRMLRSLKGLARDERLVMAFLPAFIGLLPSAGGARFSAPMVQEVAGGSNLTAAQRSFTNYWYRHVWELFSPLYPAVLLALQLGGLSLGQVAAPGVPLAICGIVAGLPFAFKGFRRGSEPSVPADSAAGRRALWADLAVGTAPIIAVLALTLFSRLNLIVVLLLVIGALLAICRYTVPRLLELVRESFSWNIVVLVIGVYVFKEMLTACGAVDQLPAGFSALRLPLAGVLFALPFTVGLLTGLTSAVVGTTFPILIPLLPGAQPGWALMTFAFVSGYAGVMLSPAHLCGTLSAGFFHADYGHMWRKVLVPALSMVLVSLALTVVF